VRLNSKLSLFATMLMGSVALAQEVVQPGAPRPITAAPPAPSPNSYIVVFAVGTPKNDRTNTVAAAGGQLRHNYDSLDAAAVTVPNANALEALRRNARVSRVVPDFVIHTQAKGGGRGGSPPPPTPSRPMRTAIWLNSTRSIARSARPWRKFRKAAAR